MFQNHHLTNWNLIALAKIEHLNCNTWLILSYSLYICIYVYVTLSLMLVSNWVNFDIAARPFLYVA